MTIVSRRFIDQPAGTVHFASCGSGSAVLLLHQTPRSRAYPHARRVAGAIAGARVVEVEGGMVPLPDQVPERFAELVTDCLLR